MENSEVVPNYFIIVVKIPVSPKFQKNKDFPF